jgi:hypothetical protein
LVYLYTDLLFYIEHLKGGVKIMANEHDFFQLDPGSIGQDWKGGKQARQMRSPGNVVANYEALKYGSARSDDYTRVVFDNAHEENPGRVLGVGFGTDMGWYNYNPYGWGSTVLKTLDDQLTRMGMDQAGTGTYAHGFSISVLHDDVSDKDEVEASGMQQYKYPSEGWRSFGGKYDFEEAYQG